MRTIFAERLPMSPGNLAGKAINPNSFECHDHKRYAPTPDTSQDPPTKRRRWRRTSPFKHLRPWRQIPYSTLRQVESNHEYPTGLRLVATLLSLFLGTFLVAIDTTIVSVAVPKISTEFHALNDVGWYGSAYLITITALQPAGGTIYKLFDAKAVY